jgi:hypothetical protein
VGSWEGIVGVLMFSPFSPAYLERTSHWLDILPWKKKTVFVDHFDFGLSEAPNVLSQVIYTKE